MLKAATALVLMAVAALAACSGTDQVGRETRRDRPTSVVEPTQDAGTARLAALAALAEQAAATLPEPRPPRPRDEPVLGADMSWPQCPEGMGIPERRSHGSPRPLPQAEFVVLGLTNGPGYTDNPCLADQVDWVRERGLMVSAYAVVSRPDAGQLETYGATGPYDGGTRLGALANAGYQQALLNVATMRNAGLNSPAVFVDVEPVPDFDWPADPVANSAVVEGAIRAYDDTGYRVGLYSTPLLWEEVVGDLALGLPEWRAAGETSRSEAERRCAPSASYQGGPAVMAQWVERARDQNVTCPGTAAHLDRWFHQF